MISNARFLLDLFQPIAGISGPVCISRTVPLDQKWIAFIRHRPEFMRKHWQRKNKMAFFYLRGEKMKEN